MYYDDDADLSLLDGKTVAIIGYGSQGHAHSLNLKDSGRRRRRRPPRGLEVRRGGRRRTACGSTAIADAASEGDLVMLLVPDELHREVWENEVRDGIAEGNMLLFGHGFSVHYGEVEPPPGVDVALAAPKGPGHLVRRQYTEGSGVPGLIAIQQDATGNAKALALAYAKGIGCTRGGVIETTFKDETETDLFGEQAVLCGGASELVQAGLRDARRGRLRPADGLLRVPPRAQAHRRPHVREGPGGDAVLDLQHRRVRRLHARQARHHRRDAPEHEEDPRGDPVRRLRPRVDRREPRRPGELQAHARRAGARPGRDDRQGAARRRWTGSRRSSRRGQASTALEIPQELKPADGRFGAGPSKVRPEQVRHVLDHATDLMGTSHRQAPVASVVGRVREGLARAVRAARRLRGRAGQRRDDRVLGRAGLRHGPRPRAAPDLRGVLVEVREGHRRARRSSADPIVVEADARRRAPSRAATPGADVVCLGAQRDLDRRDGARSSGRTGDALVLIDATSGAGGLPVDVGDADVYYFAPQKSFAADGGLWLALLSPAALDRVGEIAATDRWIPEFLSHRHGARQLAQGPDLQHARGRHAAAARRPGRVDARRTAGSTSASARTRASSDHLYGWAEERDVHRRRSSPTRRSARSSSGRSTSPTRSTPRAIAATLRANGIVDVEPYRKLGRNQLRVAMFPAIEPDDVKALTACIDWVVEQAGVTRVLVAEKIGASGIDLLREHFEVDTAFDQDGLRPRRPDRRVRRHPHPQRDEDDAGPDRGRRRSCGSSAAPASASTTSTSPPRPSAASSSSTRRSRTSSPPPSTRWRCCSRSRATSRRPTPRSSRASGRGRSSPASS